nr:hypothetical protein CFP56_69628 [Quercus suber]
MCFGDFNFVLNEDEALGGKKGSSSTNYLKEVMFEVGAIDLGYSDVKYTWAKAPLIAPHPPPLMHSWSPPPTDSIKINVDAAISDSQATIVVVACDHLGVPFQVWVMLIKRTYPLQVEIEALLWAVQLAKVEKWS